MATREELYEEAKNQGYVGISKHTRQELADLLGVDADEPLGPSSLFAMPVGSDNDTGREPTETVQPVEAADGMTMTSTEDQVEAYTWHPFVPPVPAGSGVTVEPEPRPGVARWLRHRRRRRADLAGSGDRRDRRPT